MKSRPEENNSPAVSKLPEGKPDKCGFCGTPMAAIEHNDFLTFTRYPVNGSYTVICGSCVHRLDTLRRLRNAYAIHFLKQTWTSHRQSIARDMRQEEVPAFTARVMVDLALRLSQRSARVFAGEVSMPPRIALIGKNAAVCAKLLEAASATTGMPVESTLSYSMDDGQASLSKKCNDDALMISHGILFVRDGFAESDHTGPVIYCCDSKEELPAYVEKVVVDGYDLENVNG
jgi:hypothetical protein